MIVAAENDPPVETDAFTHVSVMPEEVVAALTPKPGGVYVDATAGGGGHAALVLERQPDEPQAINGLQRVYALRGEDEKSLRWSVALLEQTGREMDFWDTRLQQPDLSADEEAAYIGQSLDSLEQSLGERPTGWAGQDCGESERTPALLAAAGVDHVIDWPNDDQPYWMHTEPPLVSIPKCWQGP